MENNNYQDPARREPLPAQTSQPAQQPVQQPTQPVQQPTQPAQQPVQQPQYQQQTYQQPTPQQQYQAPPQPQYQQPQPNLQVNNYTQNSQSGYKPVKVGEWIGAMIVMGIPIVNMIMLFVWAFGSGNPSKANWAKARLLLGVIVGVLVFIIYAIVFLIAGITINSGAFNF